MQLHLAVIIPAHNEETEIRATLESLKACRDTSVIVVADNCTDKTEEIARKLGARVIIRNDLAKIGKPYALAYALDILMRENFLYFAFIDSDTIVEPNFSSIVLEEFLKGAEAVQVQYGHQQSKFSNKQRLLDIGFYGTNTVRPLGRSFWGLSCGILGNGFALTKATIEAAPLCTNSIVEDLAYHLQLIAAGKKVSFTTKTSVLASMPSSDKAIQTQRSRWEGGRLTIIKSEVPRLCKLFLQGNSRMIEPTLDLLLPPLGFHILIVAFLFLFPMPIIRTYAWCAAGAILLYGLVTVFMHNGGKKDWLALCSLPFFLLWQITLIPSIVKTAIYPAWKRTERNGEEK